MREGGIVDHDLVLIVAIKLGDDFGELERRMTEAAARLSNIICHELYVTGDHDFMMIFMTHGQ